MAKLATLHSIGPKFDGWLDSSESSDYQRTKDFNHTERLKRIEFKGICLHEAGHIVIGYALGEKIQYCYIGGVDESNYTETMNSKYTKTKAEILSHMEDIACAICAGVLAQSLKGNKVKFWMAQAYLQDGGSTDKIKITQLIRLIRNARHSKFKDYNELHDQYVIENARLWERAILLVEDNVKSIRLLAKYLGDNVGYHIQGADIIKALGGKFEIKESKLRADGNKSNNSRNTSRKEIPGEG